MRFAMIYAPGPRFDASVTPAVPGVMRDHVALMHRLADERKLLLGGPFTDGPGGMSILDLDDRAAAEVIVTADPAVRAGHFKVAVRAWKTGEGRAS